MCKRILLFCVYFLVFAFAWAQVEVSVDLGYSNRGYNYSEKGLEAYDGTLPKGQSCYFAPRVGYWFGEQFGMGVRLGVGYSRDGYVDGYYDPVTVGWRQSARRNCDLLEVSGGMYMRFCCLRSGRLGLYAEVSGGYGWGWGWDMRTEYSAIDGSDLVSRRSTTRRSWSAQVLPVFNYELGKQVGFDVCLNFAALTIGSRTTTCWPFEVAGGGSVDEPVSETTEGVFSVGVNMLNTNVVTLGFVFKF